MRLSLTLIAKKGRLPTAPLSRKPNHKWHYRLAGGLQIEKTNEQGASIHRLRISLDHVEPSIWRSIETWSDTPLSRLADYIRCALRWSCTQACKFTIKRRDYGTHNDWGRWDPEQEFEERCRAIRETKVESATTKRGDDAIARLVEIGSTA